MRSIFTVVSDSISYISSEKQNKTNLCCLITCLDYLSNILLQLNLVDVWSFSEMKLVVLQTYENKLCGTDSLLAKSAEIKTYNICVHMMNTDKWMLSTY